MSPVLSQRALNFWLDMVPVNKIIGFGGDYSIVEKVYGHITMARENITKVLGKRISEDKLKGKQALLIARFLFHDNPKKFCLSISKKFCHYISFCGIIME